MQFTKDFKQAIRGVMVLGELSELSGFGELGQS